MDRRSVVAIKVDAAVRLAMWRTLSGVLPLYLVSEYPKSGGTWFSQMLSECLEVPFPRNRMPPLRACVMHGHQAYRAYYRNAVYVLRDGRDVMVSAYFHMLFPNERNHPRLVERTRAEIGVSNYDDVRANLPTFIRYMFEVHDRRMFRFSWAEFVRTWGRSNKIRVRYEDMLSDCAGTLAATVSALTGTEPDSRRIDAIADKYSFESQSKRRRGEESTKSFLRKGVAGDWREKFSPEARAAFHELAGPELVEAGYEPDDRWVDAG